MPEKTSKGTKKMPKDFETVMNKAKGKKNDVANYKQLYNTVDSLLKHYDKLSDTEKKELEKIAKQVVKNIEKLREKL
jgi:ElaB/YqjD/DUF883 family membrane-anchored ribosome-binding protein